MLAFLDVRFLEIANARHSSAEQCRGKAGITFGRQIGAYPILIGVEYHIPLETQSDVRVTGHGARSITGVEINLDHEKMSQKQLEAIPGIGEKTAWRLISERAKRKRKTRELSAFEHPEDWFKATSIDWSDEFSLYINS